MTKEHRKTLVFKEELKNLQKEVQEKERYIDALQRMKAEFDNFKKRTLKEKEQYKQFLLEDFILELLPVLDNLERALASEEDTGESVFAQGITMVRKQFLDVLEQGKLIRIPGVGKPFDPFLHEALSYEPSDTIPEGIIINEVLPGYMIGSKVIRHSKVIVSKGN